MTTVKELTREELLLPGNAACSGCGSTLGLRHALKVLGPRTVVVVPACCSSVIMGPIPDSAVGVPVLNIAFAAAASAASGIVSALEIRKVPNVNVVAWAGDGATADIGLSVLSGAAERGTDLIYVCYDNEAYMNTGNQKSGATPFGAWTTTTPLGKTEFKKNMPLIMADHHLPYIATACVSYPFDYIRKLRKAVRYRGKGLRYLHLLTPCPTGWRFSTERTVEVGRLAVKTGMWVLFEIEEGVFRLTGLSKSLLKTGRKPVRDYLALQGRFAKMSDGDIEKLQRRVDEQWAYYRQRHARSLSS